MLSAYYNWMIDVQGVVYLVSASLFFLFLILKSKNREFQLSEALNKKIVYALYAYAFSILVFVHTQFEGTFHNLSSGRNIILPLTALLFIAIPYFILSICLMLNYRSPK